MFRKLLLFILFACSTLLWAQTPDAWTELISNRYAVHPDVTYLRASGFPQKLDVFFPMNPKGPVPVLVYFHGGGWIWGDRTGAIPQLLPYLQMGWAVVNVEYRMADTAPAPAAVEDCLCALKWVWQNAAQYKFDKTRIVTTGHSAGGHLAMITAIVPQSAGLDNQCFTEKGDYPKVAAVIDWFGVSDVADELSGPNLKNYAVMWLGAQANREAIARSVSPITYVRKDAPPILLIHGDRDKVVAYSQAARMHEALDKAGATNTLITIPGGEHGNFPDAEVLRAWEAIRKFLADNNVTTP
jgi:acetyl esterase/lipase